jgi:hypothetical protein
MTDKLLEQINNIRNISELTFNAIQKEIIDLSKLTNNYQGFSSYNNLLSIIVQTKQLEKLHLEFNQLQEKLELLEYLKDES